MSFGLIYLSAVFLITQNGSTSPTLYLIFETFDMPFFFSAGMYGLSGLYHEIDKRYDIPGLSILFWTLALAWTIFLLYLNLGFTSLL